jgi:hypothetical protein
MVVIGCSLIIGITVELIGPLTEMDTTTPLAVTVEENKGFIN